MAILPFILAVFPPVRGFWFWLWRWFLRPNIIWGGFWFIVGLPGTRDDADVWLGWVNRANQAISPRIPQLPVDRMAELLQSNWAMAIFFGLALVGLNYKNIWRFFRLLARKADYTVAATLTGEHYISRHTALNVIQRSSWANSRRRKTEKGQTTSEMFRRMMVTMDPAAAEQEKMFKDWCELALKRFESDYSGSVRETDDGNEYEEVELKAWLRDSYQNDLYDTFGPVA